MRLSFSIVVMMLAVPLSSQQQQSKPHPAQQPAAAEQRGTQEPPLFVKELPTPKTADESTQEAHDRANKAANDTNLVNFTHQLVVATYALAGIGLLQLFVFGYQAYKLSQTVKSAEGQSRDMQRHIGEAERSANAMEEIASVIKFGNIAVMRAYLAVTIGDAVYQEKREGMGDLKFQAKPILVNTGNTQARKIKIQIAADIVPNQLSGNFSFPLEEATKDAGVLGAHLNANMSALVKDFVPWDEVADIKEGGTKALCVWGKVTYEDIFGGSHWTKFGQAITWLPNGKVWGYYLSGQNDTD